MSTDRTPAHFTISFTEWMRMLTAPMLSGPRHCSVTVSADRLDVRMGLGGWAFAASVHRSSIADVRRVDRQTSRLVEYQGLAIDEEDAVGEHGFP